MSEKQNIKAIVKEKIRTQWKTISAAFKDFSGKDKSVDGISESEL